jgi:NADH:ubiquinone oxidoreductase subunit 6 (subunit J)
MAMVILTIALTAVVCSLQAVRVARLMPAALWLAAASASVSLLLFQLGARQAAVIELSVGAGLVLILFVLAINLAGQREASTAALAPRPLAWCLAGLCTLLLAELAWPAFTTATSEAADASLSVVLWGERAFDVVVLIAFIFLGAVTVAGLLAPAATRAAALTADHEARMGHTTAPGIWPSIEPTAGGSSRLAVKNPLHREIQPWR